MNDFVANAYGVAALQDEKDTFTIYEPPETERTEDKVRLVFGVGTGLGVSILSSIPQRGRSCPNASLQQS